MIDGIETLGVEADWELRMRLEDLSVEKLFDLLSRVDPVKAASLNTSDRQNPRRLIRAIEIANTKIEKPLRKLEKTDCLWLGLRTSLEKLYKIVQVRAWFDNV